MAIPAKNTLFNPNLRQDFVNKVVGHSSLAKLSERKPLDFVGNRIFTFALDSEMDIVAENGAKSAGAVTIDPVNVVPVKFEYGSRVSDEFLYASDEEQVEYLKAFNDGFARKAARALDIAALTGCNPRTAQPSAVVGSNNFSAIVSNDEEYTAATVDEDIENAIAKVSGETNGLILAPAARAALAALKNEAGGKLYPELAWGGTPDSLNGLAIDTNDTLAFGADNVLKAVVGDFKNMFQWGIARDITLEVIEYGDPDNSGSDLKGHNQVYLRAEIYMGWAILDGSAFCLVVG